MKAKVLMTKFPNCISINLIEQGTMTTNRSDHMFQIMSVNLIWTEAFIERLILPYSMNFSYFMFSNVSLNYLVDIQSLPFFAPLVGPTKSPFSLNHILSSIQKQKKDLLSHFFHLLSLVSTVFVALRNFMEWSTVFQQHFSLGHPGQKSIFLFQQHINYKNKLPIQPLYFSEKARFRSHYSRVRNLHLDKEN